ncbi:MAG: CPBP family intramembrane glutamic endopeptidase, partial [Planctomycetota bacterium]
RLGLVRGRWPIWSWFSAAAMTPVIAVIAGMLGSLFLEESESLKEMSETFRQHGKNGFLFPMMILIGGTPGLCEELLFRGYVQTRLVKFSAVMGVIVASVLFAAAHMDLTHSLTVLPLGLYLGWVSYRSGSLFPAMLGHFVNNAMAVFLLIAGTDAQAGENVVLFGCGVVFILMMSIAGCCGMLSTVVVVERPKWLEGLV